jgi:Uri superfamily endonuclease
MLILQSDRYAGTRIGRHGWLDIRPGFYTYVGSALGPGGVRSRVSRHCRTGKSRHWHIDYLREHTSPVALWCSYGTTRLEHRWANVLQVMADTVPIAGFGCSDCACTTHLFFSAAQPDAAAFADRLDAAIEPCSCDRAGRR